MQKVKGLWLGSARGIGEDRTRRDGWVAEGLGSGGPHLCDKRLPVSESCRFHGCVFLRSAGRKRQEIEKDDEKLTAARRGLYCSSGRFLGIRVRLPGLGRGAIYFSRSKKIINNSNLSETGMNKSNLRIKQALSQTTVLK